VDPIAEMPAFGNRLSEEEMTALVEWLVRQRQAPPAGRN
jgi:mono/diheme cytochrome c family protein